LRRLEEIRKRRVALSAAAIVSADRDGCSRGSMTLCGAASPFRVANAIKR
jgi:hypothetical protein